MADGDVQNPIDQSSKNTMNPFYRYGQDTIVNDANPYGRLWSRATGIAFSDLASAKAAGVLSDLSNVDVINGTGPAETPSRPFYRYGQDTVVDAANPYGRVWSRTTGQAFPDFQSALAAGVQGDLSNVDVVAGAGPAVAAAISTSVATAGSSSIPIVGGIIDEVGAAALGLPLVGGLVGQAAVMTGISPGILALLGLGIGLYFAGAFDSGSGGRRRA